MRHRAKTVLGNEWVYGIYVFVDGFHVIYEEGKIECPMIIRLTTLEETMQED